METAVKEDSLGVAAHTAQGAAAAVEDHHMLAWNAHLPSLLCTRNTSMVNAFTQKRSAKSHGMLNATASMCVRVSRQSQPTVA